MRKNQRRKE